MKPLSYLIPVTAAVIFSNTAFSNDLLEIYQLAKTNDPQLNASHHLRLATEELRPQSLARFKPQVTLTADASHTQQENVESSQFVDDTSRSSQISLNARQTLYHKTFFHQLKQADANIRKAVSEYHDAEQNLIVRSAESYFEILSAQDNLEFAVAEKNAINRQLEQTRQRFEVGLIAITDVHEAQAAYDLAVAQEIAAENRLAIAHEALREITGETHQNLARLNEESKLELLDNRSVNDWVESATAQNFRLLAAQADVDIASEQIKVDRADHYPTFDLFARYAHSDNDSGFTSGSSVNATIGVEMELPLYLGGGVSSRGRESAHRHTVAKDRYEQELRATQRQVRNAYLNINASFSQVNALKQALISTQSALEATQAGLEVGTRTTVDVLDTRRELFRAQRDYSRARYDFLLNLLRLRQAAGILNENDVETINNWLRF